MVVYFRMPDVVNFPHVLVHADEYEQALVVMDVR